MKFNSHRVIKILSSFLVIVMVLVATVAMPVLASQDGIYNLADYIESINASEDGSRIGVVYSIDGNQLIRVFYQDGTSELFNGSHEYHPSANESKINYRVYPLGTQKTEGANMTTGAIDISDLKAHSVVSLMARFYFEMTLDTAFSDGYTDTSGYTNSFWFLFCYDAAGNYIGAVKSEPIVQTMHIDYSQGLVHWPLHTSVQVELPEATKYITPSLLIGTYLPNDPARVETIKVQTQPLVLIATKDAVVENSLTMQRIENELEEIDESIKDGLGQVDQSIQEGNHKLDTIIDGKDEWHNEAQDDSERQEELEQDAQDAMDNVDDKTDLEQVLPDGAMQPDDLSGYVEAWKGTEGWTLIKRIFKPILQNGNFSAIIFMIIAFINISVLLIGR